MGAGKAPLSAGPVARGLPGRALLALALLAAMWPAGAEGAEGADGANQAAAGPPGPADRVCALIEAAAEGHGLPAAFLARLIWKESRFDARAVSHMGALGVAQFMPATAKRRGLADPFEPAEAIPAAAAYLAELRAEFGNLGLAAAAYNAGEERVAAWLAGRRGLPGETLDYVHSITFRPARWFREGEGGKGREVEPRPLVEGRPFAEACRALPVMKTRAVLFEGAEWQPWGVQVAGNPRRAAAMAQFGRVQARFAGILGERSPMVVRDRLGGRRIWAVRIGAGSRREAGRLCDRLRAAGAACLVQRN